jgi:hypothetical protein
LDGEEQNARLIRYIAQRDRVTIEHARIIFAELSTPDLIRLDMEAQPRGPMFQSEYDPYGRD